MAVFLTIDGQTIELAANKTADEVDDLFRRRLVEGQDLDRPILLQTSSGNRINIQVANVTWYSITERDTHARFMNP
jgi:hypothetical protein